MVALILLIWHCISLIAKQSLQITRLNQCNREREEVLALNKVILNDYMDACELVKETEAEIQRLNRKKKTVVQTNVKGSSPDFPYTEQHFKVQGTTFTVKDDSQLRYEEKALEQRKARAEEVRHQVDEWLLTVPIRMQRIIRYRYLEGLSWGQVAARMGRRATSDSVRMELKRFLNEI